MQAYKTRQARPFGLNRSTYSASQAYRQALRPTGRPYGLPADYTRVELDGVKETKLKRADNVCNRGKGESNVYNFHYFCFMPPVVTAILSYPAQNASLSNIVSLDCAEAKSKAGPEERARRNLRAAACTRFTGCSSVHKV